VLELAELTWSNVAKAREVLGFETEVCLAEMLDEVIAWVVEAVQAGRI
jgi:nucleoside-diphosphate-sugar epimerase